MQKKLWLKSMPCLMMLLMTACSTLNPESPVKAIDSYCTTYIPIVRAKGEGNIQAASPVKRRILANEKTYRGLCASPAK